ncbi:hypothetical protein ACFYUY_01310 [Kitasatospora sp. NPDC004745]|uniref:hypothetical protein n=1 Tax=Kitasatospora sp. NPDC004745 TaxID=3364019 RepID=UPI0036AA7596
MLQRSTHDSPVDVPAIPATVAPGAVVDWPTPIAGFEPVPDEPAPAPAKTSRKAATGQASPGEETAP